MASSARSSEMRTTYQDHVVTCMMSGVTCDHPQPTDRAHRTPDCGAKRLLTAECDS